MKDGAGGRYRDAMRNGDAALSRFLAEWYTPHLRDRTITDVAQCLRQLLATMPAQPRRPELIYALEIPQDAYAFGVFAAESAEHVVWACQNAGLPADRVTAAVEASYIDATSH